MESTSEFASIDQYIDSFPPDVAARLRAVRQAIRDEAPEAGERFSYRMPAFELNGILVYYAAFKHHIGFYPTSSPMEAFKDELAGFKTSRGAIQLPFDQPLPLDLIRRIVAFRVAENRQKRPQRPQPQPTSEVSR